MTAVTEFDRIHPHTPEAVETEGKTIRTAAKFAIDGQSVLAEAIRTEMRGMTKTERVLVAQSMKTLSGQDSLPTASPQMNSSGDVTALEFKTDDRILTVDLADRAGEPHLSTSEQQLINGATRAVTIDQDGKLFSVDDSSGGGIRRSPDGKENSFVRIHANGTSEALANVSVLDDGTLKYSLAGEEGAKGHTLESVASNDSTISEVHQAGKPMCIVTEQRNGSAIVTTSLEGTQGTTVAIALSLDEKQAGVDGVLIIKYPDGRSQQFAADFRQSPEALAPFNDAYTQSRTGQPLDSDYWSKALADWKLPSNDREI